MTLSGVESGSLQPKSPAFFARDLLPGNQASSLTSIAARIVPARSGADNPIRPIAESANYLPGSNSFIART